MCVYCVCGWGEGDAVDCNNATASKQEGDTYKKCVYVYVHMRAAKSTASFSSSERG